jgi:hypothetical protein
MIFGNFLLEIFYNLCLQPFTIRELFYFVIVPQQHSSQRFGALRRSGFRSTNVRFSTNIY